MIYLGNGMYSDAGPSNELMHYGVLGMRWGHHQAKTYANLHTDLMRDRLNAELRRRYKEGEITRDAYKMGKKRVKADRKKQRAANKEMFKKEAYNFKHDKKYREEYKKKYKNAFIKRSSRAQAMVDQLNKQSPGFDRYAKAYDRSQRVSSALAPVGVLGGAVGGAVVGGIAGAGQGKAMQDVKTPNVDYLMKKRYLK